jgi:hypothetical protein
VVGARTSPAAQACPRAFLLASLMIASVLASSSSRAEDAQAQTRWQSSVTRIKGWLSPESLKSVKNYWQPTESETMTRRIRKAGAGYYDDFRAGLVGLRLAGADATSRVIALGEHAPRLPTFSEWARDTRAEGALVDLRDAIDKGWVLVPRESKWWREFGIAAVGVGTVVGWASFGCAVVATPAGPLWVALASKGCAIVAARGGPELIRLSYEHITEQTMESTALAAGSMVGHLLGTSFAHMGTQWWVQRHFPDYAAKVGVIGRASYASVAPWIGRAATVGEQLYRSEYLSRRRCGWMTKVAGFVSQPTCLAEPGGPAN